MGGQGQVLAVAAEAGTGKSRLVYEFKATLPNAESWKPIRSPTERRQPGCRC